jgi:hypothetical protein
LDSAGGSVLTAATGGFLKDEKYLRISGQYEIDNMVPTINTETAAAMPANIWSSENFGRGNEIRGRNNFDSVQLE